MVARSTKRSVARLMLVAMLYVQAALATAPCEATEHSAARAIAESTLTCHEPEQNTNLCVSHCLAGDQNQFAPELPVLAPSAMPVLITAAAVPQPMPGRGLALPLRATHPPPRILFQSFLI